jgi:SAM-dependent methyltransferase
MSETPIIDSGERLLFTPGKRNELHETFWAHMARYLHAYKVASGMGSGIDILDAACGSGYGTYFLSHGGNRCTGIDLDAEAVRFSQGTYGPTGCRFVQGSVTGMPFEDDVFDLVVSFETIEHLPHNAQKEFLREMHRVLRPTGKLVLSAPVREGGVAKPEWNPYHEYEPDPAELIAMVQNEFQHELVFGQIFLGPVISNHSDSAPGGITEVGSLAAHGLPTPANGQSGLKNLLKRTARNVANLVYERQYIERPDLLEKVMTRLYPGHLVKPLNIHEHRVACIVVDADNTPKK